ncbi:hypothetical protein SAMN05216602_1367 [Pseudomonas argentinensis]|uniref:Uncharacterized protein n=1 Tax=Phytopseudomonas argentinensis TaxID=289370 RepID=A0A1I3I2Y0_9GAMM|nr:hypothetical protein SAMN05216602_1367 [Pseudomonas argentinensis]
MSGRVGLREERQAGRQLARFIAQLFPAPEPLCRDNRRLLRQVARA